MLAVGAPEGSRYGLHHAAYASCETSPPTVFGDLLYALSYLFWRGARTQVRADLPDACRQVGIRFTPPAEACPGEALTRAVTVCARMHRRCQGAPRLCGVGDIHMAG